MIYHFFYGAVEDRERWPTSVALFQALSSSEATLNLIKLHCIVNLLEHLLDGLLMQILLWEYCEAAHSIPLLL